MFFPEEFYSEMGMQLAPAVARLEEFFRRQNDIFSDLSVRTSGAAQPQFHLEIATAKGEPVRLLTFPSRTGKGTNPDVQFDAIEAAFPTLNIGRYRHAVLGRLGHLIAEEAAREHRFVKFRVDLLLDPGYLEAALRAFEWMLCELRCAKAAEARAAGAS